MIKAIENKHFILIYRLVFLTGVLVGLLIEILKSENPWQMFGYYTILSNIVVLVLVLVLLFHKGKAGKGLIVAKQAVTVSILVTFLVFHILLSTIYGESFDSVWDSIGNFLVHTFTPVVMLLDFLLFDRHKKLTLKDALWSLSLPLLYFIFAEIYALLGGVFEYGEYTSPYPYYFLNPAQVGGWGVFLYVIGILSGIFILSFGMGFLHNLLQPNKKESDV